MPTSRGEGVDAYPKPRQLCLAVACIIVTLLARYGSDSHQCRVKADMLVVKMAWLRIDRTSLSSAVGFPSLPASTFLLPAPRVSRMAAMVKKAPMALTFRVSVISTTVKFMNGVSCSSERDWEGSKARGGFDNSGIHHNEIDVAGRGDDVVDSGLEGGFGG